MTDISDITKILKQIKQDISAIKTQNVVISQQVNEVKEELKIYKQEIGNEINKLKNENKQLKNEITTLKSRIQTTEKKTKKFNIVIYGIKEKNNEDILKDIVATFRHKLELTFETQEIRDAYRIGKANGTTIRPVVVEFTTNKCKSKVLENTNKLKGSGIVISCDYTVEDYNKQKYLVSLLKTERQKGHTAKIKGKGLVINGTYFTYEGLKEREGEQSEEDILTETEQQSNEHKKMLRSGSKNKNS